MLFIFYWLLRIFALSVLFEQILSRIFCYDESPPIRLVFMWIERGAKESRRTLVAECSKSDVFKMRRPEVWQAGEHLALL